MPQKRGVLDRWSPYLKRNTNTFQKSLSLGSDWDWKDWRANLAFEERLPRIAKAPGPVAIDTPGIELHQDLTLGEVSRHFDSQMSGTIGGWIEHNLGFHGWGAAVQSGGLGLGFGSLGLTGASAVHLDMAGVGRDDLVGDGFLAVFDELAGGPLVAGDTLRVIAPSENASRQMVRATVLAMGRAFGEECWRDLALRGLVPLIDGAFETQVAHASDRLHASLRQPADRRLGIEVLGTPVQERVLLGGAIRFAGDTRWYQLFPIRYIQDIVAEVSRIDRESFELSADSSPVVAVELSHVSSAPGWAAQPPAETPVKARAVITVLRVRQQSSAERHYDLLLDGRLVGRLAGGDVAYIEVTPGVHEVQATRGLLKSNILSVGMNSGMNRSFECGEAASRFGFGQLMLRAEGEGGTAFKQ